VRSNAPIASRSFRDDYGDFVKAAPMAESAGGRRSAANRAAHTLSTCAPVRTAHAVLPKRSGRGFESGIGASHGAGPITRRWLDGRRPLVFEANPRRPMFSPPRSPKASSEAKRSPADSADSRRRRTPAPAPAALGHWPTRISVSVQIGGATVGPELRASSPSPLQEAGSDPQLRTPGTGSTRM